MRAHGGELHRGSHHLPGRAGQAVLARGQRVLARPDAPCGRRSGSQTRAAGPSGTVWIVMPLRPEHRHHRYKLPVRRRMRRWRRCTRLR